MPGGHCTLAHCTSKSSVFNSSLQCFPSITLHCASFFVNQTVNVQRGTGPTLQSPGQLGCSLSFAHTDIVPLK